MNKVRYTYSLEGISPSQLTRLPVGWPKPPSPQTLLKSLQNMNAVVLAIDEETNAVVGYACGMTDHVLILYIWGTELLPEYRGQGIRKQMLLRLLDRYGEIYQINIHPGQPDRRLFEELGFKAYAPEQAVAMTRMRYEWQDGGPNAAVVAV